MDEEPDSGPQPGFLPPEPAGPEPDLGSPSRALPPEPQHHGFSPPAEPQHHGFSPPAEHQAHAPPQQEYPPAQQQLGWGAPPPAGGHAGQPQPWAYAPSSATPDNGAAVAGLVLSITAGALLLLSVGASTIISIVCAALGIYYSRQGRARVDRGETPKHRGVAQAGFITGIVTLVLSILATVFWLLFVIIYATDEGFRQDLDDELDGGGSSPDGFETTIRLGAVAVRLLVSLLR